MDSTKIEEWIKDNPKNLLKRDGSGSGYGSGYGYGDGYGSGSGYGDGYGYDYGDGSGYGDGYGYGDGDDYGDGSGYGYGDGIKEINNHKIFMIDDIPTIINHIKGNVAKGFMLNSDLTLSECYIVKGEGFFAHGKNP